MSKGHITDTFAERVHQIEPVSMNGITLAMFQFMAADIQEGLKQLEQNGSYGVARTPKEILEIVLLQIMQDSMAVGLWSEQEAASFINPAHEQLSSLLDTLESRAA